METNILKAFINISKLKDFNLTDLYSGSNRINNVGEALESFVKDAFCPDKEHHECLSYLGAQNNPPDFIIKNGDAVEVKKIERLVGSLALNSSYPKSKLRSDDVRINKNCKECDGGNWSEKDIIYSVGSVSDSKLKTLWFVYGDCYAADPDFYKKIFDGISDKIEEIGNIYMSEETNELAVIKNIDPLGTTQLRVRGMWNIDTPHKMFGHLTNFDHNSEFSSFLLILDSKYSSLPESDRKEIESNTDINIKSVEIKSPNNPDNILSAKLISYFKII